MRDITIFSGSAHIELAQEISASLGLQLSPTHIQHFSNDCLYVQMNENCRESDGLFNTATCDPRPGKFNGAAAYVRRSTWGIGCPPDSRDPLLCLCALR